MRKSVDEKSPGTLEVTSPQEAPLPGECEAILALNRRAGQTRKRKHLEPEDFGRRLDEEIERSQRTDRSLAVLAVRIGAESVVPMSRILAIATATLRLTDMVGSSSADTFLAILPETGETASVAARRLVDALAPLVPDVQVGLAVCPGDAQDPVALIAGARQAASVSEPGGIAKAESARIQVELGDRTLIALDPTMQRLLGLVQRLATSELPVLITGETGVGKDVVAQALHHWSPRRERPFVAINCAAIAETLFESELFGHERGAFTGANTSKPGLVETAAGGTLFLDEIGEIPPRVQAKLLRVLETRRVGRVGSVTERDVDIRILAASNRDLEGEVSAGRFRQDLYYRLGSARVHVPPLRERPLDIAMLARGFLADACRRVGRRPLLISPAAMRRLGLHDWPGNVRELRNLMDYCATTIDAGVLDAVHLPRNVAGTTAPWLVVETAPSAADPGGPSAQAFEPFERRRFPSIREEIQNLERTRMLQALALTAGVRIQAARMLDMPLRTFVTKMQVHGIARFGREDDPDTAGRS
jgi:DNA-binding NtrC family response regulator